MSKKKTLLHPKQIDEFSDELLAELDPGRLRQGFGTMLKHYFLLTMKLNSKERIIWRGRKCDENNKNGFNNLSELWHLKRCKVGPQRMNYANDPVLYTSNHKGAVFDEIGINEGDHVHLIAYKMKPQVSLKATFVGEFIHVYRTGLSMVSAELGEKINTLYDTMSHDDGLSLIHMDAFLAAVLRAPNIEENNNYYHSQALAYNLFQRADAIYYPSVKSENGLNLAIKGDVAREILTPIGSSVLKITQKNKYGIYDYDTLRMNDGADDQGNLHWKNFDPGEINQIRVNGAPEGWRR